MKTARTVIGIISMVLFVIITFQSCAVGIGNALDDNGGTSGSSGMFLSICMLVAGIIGVAARRSKGDTLNKPITSFKTLHRNRCIFFTQVNLLIAPLL